MVDNAGFLNTILFRSLSRPRRRVRIELGRERTVNLSSRDVVSAICLYKYNAYHDRCAQSSTCGREGETQSV